MQSQHTTSLQQAKYKGTLHCFRTIIKEESLLGFFKGMASPMAGVALINAIVFGTYGNALRFQQADPDIEPTLSQIFLAGAFSGFVNSIVASPIELAKIRLQNQSQHKDGKAITYRGPTYFLMNTYKHHGFRGLFRGISATILRETPSYGCYFTTYEWCCNFMAPEDQTKDDLHWSQLLLAGGLSGVAGWLCIYPIDVIKTRMQDAYSDGKYKYKNMWECAKVSYREEGAAVFSRGLNATILRAIPTNSVTFLIYTLTMRLLTNGND